MKILTLETPRVTKLMTLCLTAIFLCFSACKRETAQENQPGTSIKTAAKTSAQPKPGGKRYFSLAEGNFDNTGASWCRIANWVFNDVNGTVSETYWQWDSVTERAKQAYPSHVCTFENVSKPCSPYAPYGWGTPAGYSVGWSGTYTYNPSTGALAINWTSSGQWENWTVTNPVAGIAKAMFVSGSYGITHGKAYGSEMAFTGTANVNYKQIGHIPRKLYKGERAGVGYAPPSVGAPPVLTTWNWTTSGASLDMTTFTSSSSPTPANAMHAWLGTTKCTGGCATNRVGRIYHVAGMNGSRSVIYNSFCACLPTNAEWPCYNRGMHIFAFQQVIDDSGNMRGFIGVNAENDINTPLTYGFQATDMVDF